MSALNNAATEAMPATRDHRKTKRNLAWLFFLVIAVLLLLNAILDVQIIALLSVLVRHAAR